MKKEKRARSTSYPSDVTDEEWAFVAPYLTLMREDAPQREYPLRAVFNGLRWIVRAGAPWRLMPNDLPPWELIYQQTQRWLKAGVFEALVHALRALLRLAAGRAEQPSAAIFDGRTLQSSPESGARAGYDGHKRKKGSKVHLAVDTLGQFFRIIPGQHGTGRLKDHITMVIVFIHVMNGDPRLHITGIQNRFVHIMAIHAFASIPG